MAKEALNGYWQLKSDPSYYICVTRVYKKGYAIAHKYHKGEDGTEKIFLEPLKISHEDLISLYERKK